MNDKGGGDIKRSTDVINHLSFYLISMVRKRKLTSLTDEDFLPSLNAQKEDILKEFDFEYVRDVLNVPNIYKDPLTGFRTPWNLYNGKGQITLPTIETLKDIASSLLTGAIQCQDPVYVARCGPFRVIKTDGRLILDCILTTCSYD
jgi:hypothetical protein